MSYRAYFSNGTFSCISAPNAAEAEMIGREVGQATGLAMVSIGLTPEPDCVEEDDGCAEAERRNEYYLELGKLP